MTEEHKYHVIIDMIEDRVGNFILEDKAKPLIRVATPPEFPGGKQGIHSPEDLFVGAIASCKMTTFCAMAEKLDIGLTGLKVDAIGYLGQAESRGMMFTKVDVHLEITIDDEDNLKGAEKCVDLTKKYCLITNSIRSEVTMTHDIKIEK
ncbi:MAG TPA: OsmC family protein [Candidatus Bathyarchaeia archaeon]|nr:OsmC family protein [Candidatus Bathyarchaeia archaeon]